jgi:hypothetical protein
MPTISSGNMSAEVSEKVDPVWENKQYLLKVIMDQCQITTEDLNNQSIVRSKVRESKIEKIIS